MLLNFIFCLFLLGVYFIFFRIEFFFRKKINFFLKFQLVLPLCLLTIFFSPLLFYEVKKSILALNFFQSIYEIFFQNLFLGFERILSKYQQSSGDIERVEMLRAAMGYTIFYSLFVFREILFSAAFFYKDVTLEIKDPVIRSNDKKLILALLLCVVAYMLFSGKYASSCGRAVLTCFIGRIDYGEIVGVYSWLMFSIFIIFSSYLAKCIRYRT